MSTNRTIDTSTKIDRDKSDYLDSVLGHSFPVLDHGFVRVISYMGDDAAICQAARVSYGKGTKSVQNDEGLIRYLMRHWHSTPFEMCELKLHVKLPVFVARQWIRHRTACLAGDVKVDFDLPSGVTRRGNQKYTLTVKEIYEKFQPSVNKTRPDKQRNCYFKRERLQNMQLRSCDEGQMSPIHTNLIDIWESGEKEVLRVEFPNSVLRATCDHMCLTDMGWLRLGDALEKGAKFASYGRNEGYISKPVPADFTQERWSSYPLNPRYSVSTEGRVRSDRGIKKPTVTNSGYQVVSLCEKGKCRSKMVHHLVLDTFHNDPRDGRQTRHLNNNRQDNRLKNLLWGTSQENAQDRMESGRNQRQSIVWIDPVSWKADGIEMTYDIEVSGPYHNFVAGGVIVHNSVNEYSARYSILDREFYIPEPEQMAVQSTTNKQGKGELLPPEQARAFIEQMSQDSRRLYDHYEEMIGDEDSPGLSRELARINLPANIYTQWYWKIDLHNLFHFLRLRSDSHAQYEIRAYADVIAGIVAQWLPIAFAAFQEYRTGGASLSSSGLDCVRRMLAGEEVTQASSGMSAGEWREFQAQLLGNS